ncbi:MAG: hypothetical protein A3H91_10755 [Gammaproteobacteria bacterium RIFCSPLOWO2_02_FULL_61_13]|nr:MAG: hypothetical protein A3H91_10755 [Gammaproteobacteria bacterium RIFCSPLOWO2_02_FULL_61_13]
MDMMLPLRTCNYTLFAPALCLAILAFSGCSSEGDRKLPGVYRVDVQQGNVIEQEMIDKLRPGMDRNQVRFIMGTPAVADPFHADRWDYLFTNSKGGRTRQQRHVVLYFKDDKLTHMEGDVVPGERKPVDVMETRSESVDVPLERNKPGVFSRIFNALPFVGDDNARKKPQDTDTKEPDAGPDNEESPAGAETASPEPQAQPQTDPELPSP